MESSPELGVEPVLLLVPPVIISLGGMLLLLGLITAHLGRLLGIWLPSLDKWSKRDNFLMMRRLTPYWRKAYWDHPGWPPLQNEIQAYGEACDAFPSDWRLLMGYAFSLLEADRLVAGLRAAERLCELRPKDVRSTMAVALALLRLSEAELPETELKAFADHLGPKAVLERAARRDVAARELASLGLSALEAGSRAVVMMNRSLALWPDKKSQDLIWSQVDAVAARFPELVEEKYGRPWLRGFEWCRRPWHFPISNLANAWSV